MNTRSAGLLLSAIIALVGLFVIDMRLAVSVDPATTATTSTTTTTTTTPSTSTTATTTTATKAKDPGPRSGAGAAGGPIAGLTANQTKFFQASLIDFSEAETVEEGLGPTMNLDSCAGCHSQPAIGGSSPAVNPQVEFAKKLGAANKLPSFITANGPAREVRFIKNADGSPDGGVHDLFTIAGRSDAPGCAMSQPDFARAMANKNAIFRIPTPVFGAGLIEAIPDSAIIANQAATATQRHTFGIRGRPNIVLAGSTISGQPNTNGNDGTIARFGWKGQNKSLLLFSGEAYNVEMGITNELFQTERNEQSTCQYDSSPNDTTNSDSVDTVGTLSAIERFSIFMRLLAPPKPSTDTPGGAPSIVRGSSVFNTVGCAACHTPTMRTGNSTVAALRNQPVNLYSDLMLHDMGPGLADGVSQGQAGPRDFRTAPLWGLGQRLFFLHDGRTSDLIAAIQAHASGSSRTNDASEASFVVARFNDLKETQKQDLLNFLRSR
ncbi:MAG TPA: di-heme oxidoredictase family protein [Burkholderiales bacterium]|nr:di-heme oxidoredictase family protein [Burkholderiales bacterium]